ncbi:MAG: glycosyltransferase [Actinobacteria bacterium]|nr:glycosyltransferase [Actinomycetota bacterium]
MTRVMAIVIATYQRPDGLGRLLDSIVKTAKPAGWHLTVIVVDNDEENSAAPTLTAFESSLDLVSIVEPTQGIPFARNAGTQAALGANAERIVFIDDDERVESDWLLELTLAHEQFGAPITMGCVLTEFEETPPAWAEESGAFQRRIFANGTALDFAITANVMVDSEILRGNERPFDESLRYSGGSDLQLFAELRASGNKIVYASKAVAHELFPASKVNVTWLTRRQYRRGLNRSTTLRQLDASAARVAKRVVAGCVSIGRGASRYFAGKVLGRPLLHLDGRLQVAYGWGMLAGLAGVKYQEYRTVHGS